MDIMDMVTANMGQWLSIILFFAVVALVVGVLKAFLSPKKKPRRRSNYRKPYLRDVSDFRNKGSTADAAEQLRIVMEANFQSRSLLNRPEAKVFKALDESVIARNPGWQVMAQVSLGEFLSSPDKDAFLAVNSKRVDFALMDKKCRVVHALEYQGNGHHLGSSAAARDAVKKEALRKAGIGYHEIVAGHTTPSELRALVEKLVVAA